jgi:hypothetical protein
MQNFTITTDLILISLASLSLLFILLTFIYSVKINRICKEKKHEGNIIKKDSLSAKETKESETKKGIIRESVSLQKDLDGQATDSKLGTSQIDSKYVPREESITKQFTRYLINDKTNKGKDSSERKIDWK